MKEYYTFEEVLEILQCKDNLVAGRNQLRRAGVRVLKSVYDKEEIDQLAEDLLDVEEVPEDFISLSELAKLFPQLAEGFSSKLHPTTKLLLRVRELRQLGTLFRTKGSLRSKKYYPRQQAIELCQDLIIEHTPPEGFMESIEACRFLGLRTNRRPAEDVKQLAKKHRMTVRFITMGLWGHGAGSKFTYFRTKDIKKLKELRKGEDE